MDNPSKPRRRRGRIASALLAVDAWLDTSLYEIGFKAREFWEAATIFSRRFRVQGWRRAIVEVLSEGFTMGASGFVVLL
ncbi:MAG: penicillin-binding protein, partial [Mesorhizobium sp.]